MLDHFLLYMNQLMSNQAKVDGEHIPTTAYLHYSELDLTLVRLCDIKYSFQFNIYKMYFLLI